jgi:hypothetical protein
MSLGLWRASVEHKNNQWLWRRSSRVVSCEAWKDGWEVRPRDQGSEDWLWVADTWGHRQASVCLEEARRTWWSDGQGRMVTHVKIMDEAKRIHFFSWVWWFGPQNHQRTVCQVWVSKPRMEFEVAYGVIGEFALRRSYLVKGSWPLDAHIST